MVVLFSFVQATIMYGTLRIALRQCRPSRPLFPASHLGLQAPVELLESPHNRLYSSKSKGGKGKEKDKRGKENAKAGLSERDKSWSGHGTTTDTLIPGSQQVLSGDAQAEYDRANGKMQTAVDWFRREVAAKELQGSGRVTPDILKPVRVSLPGMSEGETSSLMEVATIGVREGTTLLVTVFADDVRGLIYCQKLRRY